MAQKKHVALLVETSSIYGQQILRGINRYLRSHNRWSIFLEQRALTSRLPLWLKDWRGDGIISRSTNRSLRRIVERAGIPLVDLTDRYADPAPFAIWSDQRTIGRMAAQYLMDRGFQRLAFCGFSREHWSELRLAGFQQEAASAGHVVAVFRSPWYGTDRHPWEATQRRLAEWLLQLPRPVGVMACNDVRGQHVLDACSRVDLAVPEEVAVIGVDNDELLCELCDPPLSSVIPNAERVGYEAAELLDQLMDGQKPERGLRLVEPLGIATRQSTDVYAIDDPDVAAAVRFIREHACEGISVDDVLRQVPLSRSMLERRFRKYLRRSPQREIRNVQIKRIKQLLAETDLTLEQIAQLAGFVHPEYMSVVFKREVGSTPGQYRRQAQSGLAPP